MIFQGLIDGILIGGVYSAIGIGLSLAYGVMDVVNWSHGEILMISMYIAYYFTRFAGVDPYMTIFITVAIMVVFGYTQQKFIYNKMIKKGGSYITNILIFTAGLGMLARAGANMLFGAEVASVVTKYSYTLHWGKFLISAPKLIAFIIAIASSIGLYLFIQRSEIGRAIRATSQDRNTAQLMGINANKVYCISFAISLALVGISGSILIPFFGVYPYVGNLFTFKSFIIVSLGGKGNIIGALVGGITIGIIEKAGGIIFDDNIAQTMIFALFIVILVFKPNGLLSRQNG
jgi:branched-chain amino acid transport system permease protein